MPAMAYFPESEMMTIILGTTATKPKLPSTHVYVDIVCCLVYRIRLKTGVSYFISCIISAPSNLFGHALDV
jgi:hypothetical protein